MEGGNLVRFSNDSPMIYSDLTAVRHWYFACREGLQKALNECVPAWTTALGTTTFKIRSGGTTTFKIVQNQMFLVQKQLFLNKSGVQLPSKSFKISCFWTKSGVQLPSKSFKISCFEPKAVYNHLQNRSKSAVFEPKVVSTTFTTLLKIAKSAVLNKPFLNDLVRQDNVDLVEISHDVFCTEIPEVCNTTTQNSKK